MPLAQGSPFFGVAQRLLTRFQRTLQELRIRHISAPDRRALDEPQGRGLLGDAAAGARCSAVPQLAEAEAAVLEFAGCYNFHRLQGRDRLADTAGRYNGTPFTDRGFDHVPALAHLQSWLENLRAAA